MANAEKNRSDWFGDTSPEALEIYAQMHRDMPLREKTRRIFELMDLGAAMVRDRIRRQYPEANEREVFLREAATRLDRQSMIDVYAWDPDLHP
jgi:hypothetical protein